MYLFLETWWYMWFWSTGERIESLIIRGYILNLFPAYIIKCKAPLNWLRWTYHFSVASGINTKFCQLLLQLLTTHSIKQGCTLLSGSLVNCKSTSKMCASNECVYSIILERTTYSWKGGVSQTFCLLSLVYHTEKGLINQQAASS